MQFGVKVRGGIEYAYHSVRLHMMALWNQYEVEEPEEPEKIPGVLKIDYKNGYNSPKRSRMLSQVESKVPHMLRFTRYLYAQRAKFVVMHKGAVVGGIDSVHGSQEGDPLGGHLFALAIYAGQLPELAEMLGIPGTPGKLDVLECCLTKWSIHRQTVPLP